jgi:SWI/SNF-related matrix-associated actin-dependent regulator 1 of chromatin subfamily A
VADLIGNPRGLAWSLAMGLVPKVALSQRDRALAFVMALSGNPEKALRILLANPDAMTACDLTPGDIMLALGGNAGRFDRLESLMELEVERARWAGWLHWTHIDDLNLMLLSATRIPSVARAWLNAKLHPIPGGWVMPPRWVNRFVAVTPVPISGEAEFLEAATDASIAASGQMTRDFPSVPVRFRVRGKANGIVTVDWDDPFGVPGKRIKEVVKLAGGDFDGKSRCWDVPEDRMPKLASALTWEHEVIPEGLEEFLEARSVTDDDDAERIAAGMTTIHLVREDTREVHLRLSSRHRGFWDLVQSFGGRYVKGVHVVPVMALGDLVRSLEGLADIEDTGVLGALRRHEDRAFALEQTSSLIRIPETTPTGVRLFRHQVEGADFLARASGRYGLKGAILADDMGMGKSVQAIIAADVTHAKRGAVLVLAPAGLKLSWRDEITTWLGPDKRIFIAEGRTAKPVPKDAEWIICGFETVADWVSEIIAAEPVLAIVDEAQRMGTRGTNMAKGLFGHRKERGILPVVPAVWCLTGTPIQNRPAELHNLLRAIGHPLGDDYIGYGKHFCAGVNNGHGWNFKGASNLPELAGILRPFVLRRTKADTLGLPERIRQIVRVRLDGEALTEYRRGVAALLSKADDGILVGQITLMKRLTALSKAQVALDLVQDVLSSGGKVVVFSEYPEVLNRIAAGLPKAACVRIDGAVPTADRKGIEDKFQSDPKIRVFLGQIRAAGVGLNLTAAQDVIVVDLPWNPKALSQAEDRVHRIGSHGVVTVRRILAEGTLDHDLHDILRMKEGMADDFEGGLIKRDTPENEDGAIMREVIRRVRKSHGA